MKYVEQQGEEPFDWWGFLYEKNKTDGEKKEAKKLSGHWVTCGCGNKDARIERCAEGRPKDVYLAALGYKFWLEIDMEDYVVAKETLRKIDSRELELLKEYEENLKAKNSNKNETH